MTRLLIALVSLVALVAIPLVVDRTNEPPHQLGSGHRDDITVLAAPPPDPCFDYLDLEAGRAAPERQQAYNNLDARGFTRWRMACVYGWGADQWECVDQLWQEESSWYHLADGHADTWGIPQAYPGSKMAEFGDDWRTNPRTQTKWGLEYIRDRYGVPTNTPRACHAGY